MAIENTNNLPEETFIKYNIIRTALLFNAYPHSLDESGTLNFVGMRLKPTNKVVELKGKSVELLDREAVLIPLQGHYSGNALQSAAANDMSLLKQVYNNYATFVRRHLREPGMVPVYNNLATGYNFEESYKEARDPEDYVEAMLEAAVDNKNLDAAFAGGYKNLINQGYNQVINLISKSNWQDKDLITNQLKNYWAKLQTNQNFKAGAVHSQLERGEE